MNTCKEQSISPFMTEFLVVQKPVRLLDRFLYNRKKDSRRSSSTYTKSLFVFVLFFLSGFSFTNFKTHRTAGGGGDYQRISFLPLPPASQLLLKHQQGYCCREFTSVHSWNRTWNLWYTLLEFTLSTLALAAAVVRTMLITRVTLGNISRVLLNLTKRSIFAMQCSKTPRMFAQLTVIFSLQFINYGCFSS